MGRPGTIACELWVGVHCNEVYSHLGLTLDEVLDAMRWGPDHKTKVAHVLQVLRELLPDDVRIVECNHYRHGFEACVENDMLLARLNCAGNMNYAELILGKLIARVDEEAPKVRMDHHAVAQALEDLASLFERCHIGVPRESFQVFLYQEYEM